ncbi:MAG: prepilin-type N-terminal cleavage/methylation domain-containing protein [Candidatus Omnitrophica bacterium]|nr:prepilin-type N-terminal cleavage/methylation domain-containing protein [Candidatus Omnitrophota bacterium]MBU4478509.1 prepilin-type N-terminal cleavage/methylation domain-containing protein [Candidatus Omnitrophota bacterium]
MNKKGFTLIELLIVIAILGILVALILPRFSDVRTDANTKVCVANLRGLASAMATYETKENKDVTWGGAATGADELVTWQYIAAEPFCPYEQTKATPVAYTLVPSAGNVPDKATCPNVGAYADHLWP